MSVPEPSVPPAEAVLTAEEQAAIVDEETLDESPSEVTAGAVEANENDAVEAVASRKPVGKALLGGGMEALAGGFLLGGAAVCGIIGAAGAAVAAKSQGTIGEKAREYGDKVAGVGENLKKMDEDGKHSAKAKELLGSVLSQAKEAAGPLLEKAKESAAPVLSKAKEAAAPVISKAKEAKEDLSKKDWAQMQADAKEQLGKAKDWTKGVVSKAAGGGGAADGPPQ